MVIIWLPFCKPGYVVTSYYFVNLIMRNELRTYEQSLLYELNAYHLDGYALTPHGIFWRIYVNIMIFPFNIWMLVGNLYHVGKLVGKSNTVQLLEGNVSRQGPTKNRSPMLVLSNRWWVKKCRSEKKCRSAKRWPWCPIVGRKRNVGRERHLPTGLTVSNMIGRQNQFPTNFRLVKRASPTNLCVGVQVLWCSDGT
jgi:hypothetical protein